MHISPTTSPQPKPNGKRTKEGRKWDTGATGEEAAALDFSSPSNHVSNDVDPGDQKGPAISTAEATSLSRLRGIMKDELAEVHVSSDEEQIVDEEEVHPSKMVTESTFSKNDSAVSIRSLTLFSCPYTDTHIFVWVL